jgi:hypothetical protein
VTTETTAPERYTTCECIDGAHHAPKVANYSYASESDAEIIARHTGRHVVPVSDVRTEVAA